MGELHGHHYGERLPESDGRADREPIGYGRARHLAGFALAHLADDLEQPKVTTQPKGVSVWWGYGLRPERNGHYVKKPMVACSGAEILEEVVKQLKFDANLQTILGHRHASPASCLT